MLHFSLVLYKHSLQDVMPLLASIAELSQALSLSPLSTIKLSIYDNSKIPLVTKQNFASILPSKIVCNYHNDGINIGFGAAHNFNFNSFQFLPLDNSNCLFIPINPDISFSSVSFLSVLHWLSDRDDVVCCAPLIEDPSGSIQYSAKKNPTFLSLLAGRFSVLQSIPFVAGYMRNHANMNYNYRSDVIHSTYLSGCLLVIRSSAYLLVGGFSEKFFLHLEDADITRKLCRYGLCVHCPFGTVVHLWARGSHRDLKQIWHLFRSYIQYICFWGFRLI